MASGWARPRFVVGLALAASIVLAACSGSGFRYVKSSEANTFFKVPGDWKLYDEETIFSTGVNDLSPQQTERLRAAQWVVAFDGSPKPALKNVLEPRSRHPQGLAKVRVIPDEERDTFSLASLRNEAFPIDEIASASADVEVIRSDDIVLDGGFRGTRVVYNLPVEGGGYFTVDQTALVNDRTTILYILVVGCEASCYVENEKLINQIAESWTIKER